MRPRLALASLIGPVPRPVHGEVTSRLAEIRRLQGEVAAVAHAVRALRRDLDGTTSGTTSGDAGRPTEPPR